jgi:hypothetical protein
MPPTPHLDGIALNCSMIDELWIQKNLEGSSNGMVKVLVWHLLFWAEDNHKKPVIVAGVQTEIQTKLFPNKSVESVSYTSLHDVKCRKCFLHQPAWCHMCCLYGIEWKMTWSGD